MEKYINDSIAKKRIPLEQKMFKATLIKRKVITDTVRTPLKMKQDSILRVKQKNDSIQKVKAKQDSIKNKNIKKDTIQ
jgi:hypothetical protein